MQYQVLCREIECLLEKVDPTDLKNPRQKAHYYTQQAGEVDKLVAKLTRLMNDNFDEEFDDRVLADELIQRAIE